MSHYSMSFNLSPARPGPGLTGRLIIAMPQLGGGPFDQSVVLICRHDQAHAYGLILNKPILGLAAKDAITDIRLRPSLTSENAPIYFGGPCDTELGTVLHSPEHQGPQTIRVGTDFAVTKTQDALGRLMGDQVRPQHSRVFAGHAGWSPGQLDDELRRNVWLDIPATADLVFKTPPKDLWDAAIGLAGISSSSLSAMSADTKAGARPLN
ncbi:MAG: YqgE/AlgH family protein [Pseudomonadota bacterium]